MDWQRFSRLISLCCDDPGTDPQQDLQQHAPLNECAELFRQLLNVSAGIEYLEASRSYRAAS
jgi:hypothetical protein